MSVECFGVITPDVCGIFRNVIYLILQNNFVIQRWNPGVTREKGE